MDDPCVARTQDKDWMPAAQWLQRHEKFLAEKAANPDPQVVFMGDSITEGWKWENGNQQTYGATFGPYRPLNLGISGDETQHVLWRLEHGEVDGIKPAAVVLLIGTNNLGNSGMSASQTAPGVRKVVSTLRAKLPATQILHLAVFPRGRTADDPLRRQVGVLNELLAAGYRQAPDPRVRFVDLAPRFAEADGTLAEKLFPDALHLAPEAYQRWAALIGPTVAEMAGA